MTSDQTLGLLERRMQEARTRVDHCRNGRGVRDELAAAQRDLLQALKDYTNALERRELPVPWRLRDELKLHRDLFDR